MKVVICTTMCIIGHSTGYRPVYARLAYNSCRLGATPEQLPELLDVPAATIDRWIATIPEFEEEIRQGSRMADATVAGSLYRLAIGAHHKVARHEMPRQAPDGHLHQALP